MRRRSRLRRITACKALFDPIPDRGIRPQQRAGRRVDDRARLDARSRRRPAPGRHRQPRIPLYDRHRPYPRLQFLRGGGSHSGRRQQPSGPATPARSQ